MFIFKSVIKKKCNFEKPEHRLGSGPLDAEELKRHNFFRNVDWGKVARKEIKPPFVPQIKDENEEEEKVKYIDPVFLNHDIGNIKREEEVEMNSFKNKYEGFTYINTELKE